MMLYFLIKEIISSRSFLSLVSFLKSPINKFFSSEFSFWNNKITGKVTLPSKKSCPTFFPNNFKSEL